MIAPEDRDLLQAYLDHMLPDADAAALEKRLVAEPPLADALIEISREEAILREWAAAARAGSGTLGDETGHPTPRRVTLRRLMLGGAIAGVAAMLAVAILAGLFRPTKPTEPLNVALLEEVEGEVYLVPEHGDAVPARSGQKVTSGQELRTLGEGSFAVLTFDDNSRFELGSDTTIKVNPAAITGPGKCIFLETGVVAADVARQPEDRPMILTTPHAEVRFSQTKSSFTSVAGETRIESEKGPMRVTRKADGRSIDLLPGWFAVASQTGTPPFAPQLQPTRSNGPRSSIGEGNSAYLCLSFSPDGSLLVAGCADGAVKIWETSTGKQRLTFKAHKRCVKAVAFCPVGYLLATAGDDKTVRLWDGGGSEVAKLPGVKGNIEALAFSSDGALLAGGGGHGKNQPEIHLWNVAGRTEVANLAGHKNGVTSVAFSRDGRTLATGGKDNVVKLWDVPTRSVRLTLEGHTAKVNAVAFVANGNLVASGSKDRTTRLWDTTTGVAKQSLPSNCGEVRSLAFSPDGRTLAVADQVVTLWDATTGQSRLTLKGHKNGIGAVLYAPGGKSLATAGHDRTVKLWDATAQGK